ncbi:hypothetical protein ACOJCD_003734 [Cronobacter dublinensis]
MVGRDVVGALRLPTLRKNRGGVDVVGALRLPTLQKHYVGVEVVGALRLPTLHKHYDGVGVVGARTRHHPLTHRLRRVVLFGFRAGGGQIR